MAIDMHNVWQVFFRVGLCLIFVIPAASAQSDNSAVILMYHNVSAETPASTSVTAEKFTQHMKYLADNQYTVFHFIPAKIPGRNKNFTDIYLRTRGRINGFYGLPDFDSISYQTNLTLKTLKQSDVQGQVVFWNPGTGHLPYALYLPENKKPKNMIFAGNDLLQLKASEYNIDADDVRLIHLPVISSISMQLPEKSIDFFVANPVMITGAGVEEELMTTAASLLRKGGKLLVSGRSSDIARIEKHKKQFTELSSQKYRGFRVLLLQKSS